MRENRWANRPVRRNNGEDYVIYENIHRNIFFSLKNDSRTRGHEVTLVKAQCRLDIRKYSFSQRTINEWNKLSTECVNASSVNFFYINLQISQKGGLHRDEEYLDSR